MGLRLYRSPRGRRGLPIRSVNRDAADRKHPQKAPGTFFFIGSGNDERGLNYGHHHPKFDFDEQALVRGAALMAASALEVLQEAGETIL